MILVSDTVVYKITVMVKFFNAFLAVVAVKSPPRLDYSAVKAEII